MALPTMPVDIQAELDQWLAANPEAQKYVTKLYYVPGAAVPPPDATHVLRLNSQTSMERTLRVGIVAKPEYAAAIDMLLAMLATQPG